MFGRAGDAAFAKAFAATASVLVAILGVKSFFESIVMALQAFLRGRGETAAVFRIQLLSSVAFWIPLFLAVRAYRPGIPAYWLTMIACSGLSAALLAKRALARR